MNNLSPAPSLDQDEEGRQRQGILDGDVHAAHSDGDACMFCDDTVGLARSGEDPMGFRDHLSRHDHCRREYQLWKQVITDEWLGD